jgi:hypothetical protein
MPVAETRFGRAARIAPESPGAALGADLENVAGRAPVATPEAPEARIPRGRGKLTPVVRTSRWKGSRCAVRGVVLRDDRADIRARLVGQTGWGQPVPWVSRYRPRSRREDDTRVSPVPVGSWPAGASSVVPLRRLQLAGTGSMTSYNASIAAAT